MHTAGNGNTLTYGGTHEHLALEIDIPESVYLYTYLSNESRRGNEVYFDDYSLTMTQGVLVQSQAYYPFGLPMEGTAYHRSAGLDGPPTAHLYQGKELQREKGLDRYDFHARQYDPAIGRFLSADPQHQFYSPYIGMGNSPVMMVDPDGEWVHIAIGAIAGGAFNLISNWNNIKGGNIWQKIGSGASYFGVGAVAGAVSAGTGNFAASGAILGAGNTALQGGDIKDILVNAAIGGAAGYVGGVVGDKVSNLLAGQNISGFLGGFASGALGGASGGFVNGFGSGLYRTGDFGEALNAGGKGALYGGLFGGFAGGLIQGISALKNPPRDLAGNPINQRNFWTGRDVAKGRSAFAIKNTSKPQISVGEPQAVINGHIRGISRQMQNRHIAGTTENIKYGNGRSIVTDNPTALLNDLHSGNYNFVQYNKHGLPIVRFNRNIGVVIRRGQQIGTTPYGTIHYQSKTGRIHIVPWLPHR